MVSTNPMLHYVHQLVANCVCVSRQCLLQLKTALRAERVNKNSKVVVRQLNNEQKLTIKLHAASFLLRCLYYLTMQLHKQVYK